MPVEEKQKKPERLATETVGLPIYYTKSGKAMGEMLKISITIPGDWRQKTTKQKSIYILKQLQKAHSDFATIRHKPSKDEALGPAVAKIKKQLRGEIPENLLVPVAKAIKQINDATEEMIKKVSRGGFGKIEYSNLPRRAVEAWKKGKTLYLARTINLTSDRSKITVNLPVYDSESGEKLGRVGLPVILAQDWQYRTAEQQRKYIRGELAKFNTDLVTIWHKAPGAKAPLLPVAEVMKQVKKATTIRKYVVAVNVYRKGEVVGQAVLTVGVPDNFSESETKERLKKHLDRLNGELRTRKEGTLEAPKGKSSAAGVAAFAVITERMMRKLKAIPKRTTT